MSVFTRSAVPVLAGALVASCTLGPNYKRPVVQTPATFRGAAAPTAESLADLKWFDLFRDDTLTQLVNSALKQNFELRIAAERVLQARALYGITHANQFPTVDASVALNALRTSRDGAAPGIPAGVSTDVSYAQAGFTLGWEIDVWGRLRRLNEAARAQYLATEEAQRGVITTLVADVSQTYLQLRALDSELEIARRTRDAANHSLQLTEARRSQRRRQRTRCPPGGTTAVHRHRTDCQPRASRSRRRKTR